MVYLIYFMVYLLLSTPWIYWIEEIRIRVFRPVESKFSVHFRRSGPKTPDNPEILAFPDYRGLPVPSYENEFQIRILHRKIHVMKRKKAFLYMQLK